MPRGPSRQWRARKLPFTHEHIQASMQGGRNEHGHYATLVYTGCETRERAEEIKRSLYRCGKQLGVSVHAEVEPAAAGGFQVRFKAIDKAAARAYVLQRYGNDRTRWPYNPRRQNPPPDPGVQP
jgi:hypothetical protein